MMYEKERKELADICHLLYGRSLVAATDGNVSFRTAKEHILLTPSGKNKGFVRPEEMLVVDLNTHPVYATAFALAGKNIPENYLIETKMMLKRVALAGYATPGTLEMADAIAPYVADTNAVLLQNHGALTLGKDLMDAFNKMEVLESVAKTIILSKAVGEPVVISKENLDKMGNRHGCPL